MNKRPIRILLIDDDEDDYFLTRELFEELPGFEVEVDWTPEIEVGIKSLHENKHEAYFVDYLLGGQTGIDFLRSARQLGIKNPIIMLTGKGDHHIDKMAMEFGASDYLVKSELDVEKLERSLRYAIDRSEDRIQLEKSEAKYRSIFERSRDIIFIADHQGNIFDSNESVSRILEYKRHEIAGMNLLDLLDDQAAKDFIREQLNSKREVHDFEQLLSSKSGKKKICLLSLGFLDVDQKN